MGALIPIVAITSSIGIPAVVIIIAMFISHKRKMARYGVIEKAIATDANPEVIEQLVATIGEEDSKRRTPPRQQNLIHAVILLALGLSFFGMRLMLHSPDDLAGVTITGMILTLLSVAKFVIALLILKKDSE